MSKEAEKILKHIHKVFSMWLFDPWVVIKKMMALPFFIKDFMAYKRLNKNRDFNISLRDIYFSSYDRFLKASIVPVHYFYQDLWAAKFIFDNGIEEHTDVGSRIDGFIAHILPFCKVTYIDIRPLDIEVEGFYFRQGSILQMPFSDNSIISLSCLHVIEHIGLGRYGDIVDPLGYQNAAWELSRVLQPGGYLLLAAPVGRQRLCFDGHRIFGPKTIINAFDSLKLDEFSLINDEGRMIIHNASLVEAQNCEYGCGLFVFRK